MKLSNYFSLGLCVVFGAIMGLGLAYFIFSKDIMYARAKNTIDTESGLRRSEALDKQAKHLAAGMSKAQVASSMGPPDNVDDQYVWIWGNSKADTNGLSWRTIWSKSDFLVFDERGKLLCPRLLKMDPPVEVYIYNHEGPCNEDILKELRP